MTAAFKGGLTFYRGTSGSPAYAAIEEVRSLSGFGKTNPLLDATSHDSTAMEYIAGLSDGQEITVECLRVHTASAQQHNLITDVDTGDNINCKIVLTDTRSSPNLTKTYTFAATPPSWAITPSYSDANMISFTLKISGAITAA